MDLKKFEQCIADIDKDILKKDEYTFFVLTRILDGECTLTVTDGERLVICYSCAPYPVWVWTPDDVTEVEKARTYDAVKEYFGFGKGFRFNMKYPLAEYFIKRAKDEGTTLGIFTNITSYACEKPIAPTSKVKGSVKIAAEEDLEDVIAFIDVFHKDVGMDEENRESYRKRAEALIKSRGFFFWIDEKGEKVASCSRRDVDEKSTVGSVYTKPEKRRRGYAAALVYKVTEQIFNEGKMPVLYADTDYAASNGCYIKIGYRLKGTLCTIG